MAWRATSKYPGHAPANPREYWGCSSKMESMLLEYIAGVTVHSVHHLHVTACTAYSAYRNMHTSAWFGQEKRTGVLVDLLS